MKWAPEKSAEHFFYLVGRMFMRHHRPWWRHPRWHFRHWRFQLHPLQQLKRVLFERCATCGKGFRWGYSPTSTGNDDLHHCECLRASAAQP